MADGSDADHVSLNTRARRVYANQESYCFADQGRNANLGMRDTPVHSDRHSDYE